MYTASFKEFGSLVCLWHDVKLRKTQLEVRSPNVTWRRDLWCHRVIVFLKMCQIVGWIAMANLAALRAAVFSLSAKNLRGGRITAPPAVRELTRAPLGGGAISSPPSRFLVISSKPMQVSPRNLQYPLSQYFYTLWYNFKVQGIIVRPQMTSEWRHVPPISTGNKGLGESPPRVQF